MGSLGERNGEDGLQSALRQLLGLSTDASGWRSHPADPAAYDGIFERLSQGVDVARRRLDAERKDAPARWQALEPHPQTRRLVRIGNDRRFQTVGFHQFLLAKSRKLAEIDPRKAQELAELALGVAKSLASNDHGEERTADLRAAAWIAIGDARGHLRDANGAWDALDCAQEALEEGTGDPLDKADLETLRARLLKAAGRDEEAARATQRAGNLLRKIGDRREEEPGHRRATLLGLGGEVRERIARG